MADGLGDLGSGEGQGVVCSRFGSGAAEVAEGGVQPALRAGLADAG